MTQSILIDARGRGKERFWNGQAICWDRGRPARNERAARKCNHYGKPSRSARLRRVCGRAARGPSKLLDRMFCRTIAFGKHDYVVGLDIHIGFIVNDGDEVYFVHSSYVDPFMLLKETGLDSKILQTSAYRVLGKITADDELIKTWLLKKEIVTRNSS